MHVSRRRLLSLTRGTAGLMLAAPLVNFFRQAGNTPLGFPQAIAQVPQSFSRFGPLRRDPAGLLDLPEGFQYSVLSPEGDSLSDGTIVPSAHDGMAAFAGAEGTTILVRNHELDPTSSTAVVAPSTLRYDGNGKGGTTTLVLSRDRQLLRHYVSLAGTIRNCAGGATPWGSWLSCEEDTTTPVESALVTQPHGYVFEVPAMASSPVQPTPLKALGRFRREAIAVDPRSGILYQTEDRPDGLLYRFTPTQPSNLGAGGTLEALRIQNRPGLNTHRRFPIQHPVQVDWVPIEEVDPVNDTVRIEGHLKGAAQFSRGEGICYSEGSIYFTCTNGGDRPYGQVWRYTPHPNGGSLELLIQPNDPTVLDFPDNLIMAPWGDLVMCEDGAGQQFLVGLTPNGELYKLARNARDTSEFAGICFSPDGNTLFVNLYSPGMTFAIWRRGDRWV